MSTDRDTTRIVRSWLSTDEHESADRVLDAVLDQLDTTPQRHATWWPARRTPTMNKFLAIGLGGAAVVVALLVGYQVFGSSNTGLGGGPSATPEPSVTPASIAEPSPSVEAGLPEGPFAFSDGTLGGGAPFTVTIPAPGWYGDPLGALLAKNDNPDPPDGSAIIVFGGDLYVYGDPCQWASTTPDTPATTVDELVAALTAQASRDASEPVDITVDGYAGKSITLHVPDDAVFSDCDRSSFGSWAYIRNGVIDPTPSRYHQGPGQIDELWIVDVDGVVTVIDAGHYDGTPPEDVAELHAIVESITFE